jgi:CTP:molybdopterin cytidylyltransferase MocA
MRRFAEPVRRSGWTAILLAGGESRRYGGVPKATAIIDGVAAIVRMGEAATTAGFAPCLAVAGRHLAETERALHGSEIPVLENSAWAQGRTGSIQVGIRGAGPAEGVLLWPVDHPFVEAKSLATLLRCAEEDTLATWLIPTFERRGGHPILLRRPTFSAILALAPDAPLRSLLPSFGPQVRRVPLPDRGVIENVDDPASFDAALACRHADLGGGSWTAG